MTARKIHRPHHPPNPRKNLLIQFQSFQAAKKPPATSHQKKPASKIPRAWRLVWPPNQRSFSEAQRVTAARPAQKAVAQRDYCCATAESSGSPLFP
ncbi:hypothetical protein PCANC_08649 [Puccinia coronata f. sp. avenae]|uniref:Uncharacterized protein n=1 Tax=Puccinia coronata f. sp. avenae TaxID=200324 RepID=A0A2N5T643_9BASI|nr:hypothetical protein PCANC_08649 [Puccinia coronata f. sp. avenae]